MNQSLSRRLMKLLTGALFFAVFVMLSFFAAVRSAYVGAAVEVCDLIEEHYYRRDEPEVSAFLKTCRDQARSQEFLLSKERNVHRLNQRLAALGVSHLSIYSPVEDRLLWDNEGLETGLRARRIDDKLVVYRILPKSAGERAGVRVGDAIISIAGEEPSTSWEVQTRKGLFKIERSGRALELELVPTEVAEDLKPGFEELRADVGHLMLSSFLPQYFAEAPWRALVAKLARYPRLVIDLRGNAGGSFPAMLRALSPFLCDGHEAGVIRQASREGLKDSAELRDVLDADAQLGLLAEARELKLVGFKEYGCYKGSVTVLIDSETSSTAEIFAHAFLGRPHARVWGQPSSGRVVMAQWFPLRGFGEPEYTISIPIAGFVAPNGDEIEGTGVTPERTLFYDLAAALKGRDSWLEASVSE